MELISDYLERTWFSDYDDFKKNFTIKVPESFDFARDVVDEWARLEPDKRALVYCDDDGNEREFTFQEISLLSKKVARYLTQLGIKKGDRIVTILRRRWEYWIIAVAICRIGALVSPTAIQMTEKDLAYRINECGAKLLIALEDDFVLSQIKNLKEKCPTLKNIALAAKTYKTGDEYLDFDREFADCSTLVGVPGLKNEDEMIIYFTSGTSGYPKMAIHNRIYPLGHIVTAKYMQCVINDGLHLTQTDSGWAKFGWGNIYGQWIAGSAILAYDPVKFSPKALMEVIKKFAPTTICIPPTMYRFLLHEGITSDHLKSVKWFSTAGEPLSGEVNKEIYNLTGLYIHEGFGQSEGTPITCSFQWLEIKPSSMGKPSPLYDVRIIRPDRSECSVGETGEVVIFVKDKRGQLGLLDYYQYSGDKVDPVVDGIYHTGDTAYRDKDGYFWYVGRVDDMIKCSGYRIGPFEIESVLNTHPAVKESAIVGAPDPIRGQIVCAVIALRGGFSPSDELTKELQQYVKKNTAPYKYPRKIVYVDELPKTTTGKIVRNEAKKLVE